MPNLPQNMDTASAINSKPLSLLNSNVTLGNITQVQNNIQEPTGKTPTPQYEPKDETKAITDNPNKNKIMEFIKNKKTGILIALIIIVAIAGWYYYTKGK